MLPEAKSRLEVVWILLYCVLLKFLGGIIYEIWLGHSGCFLASLLNKHDKLLCFACWGLPYLLQVPEWVSSEEAGNGDVAPQWYCTHVKLQLPEAMLLTRASAALNTFVHRISFRDTLCAFQADTLHYRCLRNMKLQRNLYGLIEC